MTYVEFFDANAIANVCSCLIEKPDRVILLGENEKLMKKHIANYTQVFLARGQAIDFIYKRVSRTELTEIIDVIEEIVAQYDDCVFDITGGTELLCVALGVVYGRHPEIQIQKFNPRSGVLHDCDASQKKNVDLGLTIAENVKIYGGEVAFGGINEQKTYLWDLNDEFLSDVWKMWSICKKDVGAWNTQLKVLETVEEAKSKRESSELLTVATFNNIKAKEKKNGSSYVKIIGVLGPLLKAGLLTDFDDTDGNKLRVGYKNEQVKKCLTKAGQILEMAIYLKVKDLKDNDTNAPLYDDVMTGVFIDWDGEYHDEKKENVYDTDNEIDVMLMYDAVPIFVSCKNGRVSSDELYKLEAVADRFGGPYAKKVLIANAIDNEDGGKYLRQRAIDMGIRLIEKVQNMQEEQLTKELKKLHKNLN